MGIRALGNTSLGFAMNFLTGRYSGQLSLFDVAGFHDTSQVRLGPSGKPWVGVDEVSAAAETLREMVSELQEEITELNSEYHRLVRVRSDLPSEDEEFAPGSSCSSVRSSG
jgi:hypothetical protein